MFSKLSRRNESLIPKVLTKRFSEMLQKKKRKRKRSFFGFLYPNTIKEKINPVKENRFGHREGWIDRSPLGIDRSRADGSKSPFVLDLDRSIPSWRVWTFIWLMTLIDRSHPRGSEPSFPLLFLVQMSLTSLESIHVPLKHLKPANDSRHNRKVAKDGLWHDKQLKTKGPKTPKTQHIRNTNKAIDCF